MSSSAPNCAWCNGTDMLAQFDNLSCLSCGQVTDLQGAKALHTSVANEGGTVESVSAELNPKRKK